MNGEFYSNSDGNSIKSDNISNFQIDQNPKYRIIYIISNILLIIVYIIAFIFLVLFREKITVLSFQEKIYMQTHLTSFLVCIAIHIIILSYSLFNAIKQRDFDFKKQFYSDRCYSYPVQNFLFCITYILGVFLNVIKLDFPDFNIINIFSIVFLVIYLILAVLSYFTYKKNRKVINLSYKSMVCIYIQSAVNFSLSSYFFFFTCLFIFKRNDFFSDETMESLTIAFYIVYTIIGIALLARKEISFSIILIIILVGCIYNSYESIYSEFKDKEIITLDSCLGVDTICFMIISFKYRKEIFSFKNDNAMEIFLNNRLIISSSIDPTI